MPRLAPRRPPLLRTAPLRSRQRMAQCRALKLMLLSPHPVASARPRAGSALSVVNVRPPGAMRKMSPR